MNLDFGLLKRMRSFPTGRIVVNKPSNLNAESGWPMYHMVELLVDMGYAQWDEDWRGVARITAKGLYRLEKEDLPLARDAAHAAQVKVTRSDIYPERPAVDATKIARRHFPPNEP